MRMPEGTINWRHSAPNNALLLAPTGSKGCPDWTLWLLTCRHEIEGGWGTVPAKVDREFESLPI